MPSMMRRFTSAPKPAPRVLRYMSESVCAIGADRVADAVVAGQIRARFRSRNDVVAGQRVLGVRQADFANFAAQAFQFLTAASNSLARFAPEALEILFRQPQL